jgi:hypothetical protein
MYPANATIAVANYKGDLVMPDKTLLIKHIPEDLHRDFKALCASEGVTMGWKVRELITHQTNLARFEEKRGEG